MTEKNCYTYNNKNFKIISRPNYYFEPTYYFDINTSNEEKYPT